MAWLIGIVCIVIVISFWRIFLPLAVIAGIGLGVFFLYDNIKQENLKKEELLKEKAINARIAKAKETATSIDKQWEVFFEPDPATGKLIARSASIQSDDGLCFLRVEKRINGVQLTDLSCPEFEIDKYADIDIKFDTDDISRKMRLEGYSNGEGVYITPQQYEHSGDLKYTDFISRLSTAGSLAINIPIEEISWVRFNLKGNGASEAISLLGKPEGYIAKIPKPEAIKNYKPPVTTSHNIEFQDDYHIALRKAEEKCKVTMPRMELGYPEFNKCVSSTLNSMGY